MRGLRLGGGDADAGFRRQLGEPVEGLEVRLGQEGDHRDAPAVQAPLHLGEVAEAGDGDPPPGGALPAPHDRGQLAEEHAVDVDRQVRLELAGEEVELGRAALHEEDLHGPLDGGGPDPGQAQHAHREIVGAHPERGRPDHRVLQEALPKMRGGACGRRGGHEHASAPPGLHVTALLEVLHDARDRVGVDPEEAGQLADAGQGLLARDAAALDDVLELLRQLPADRDGALRVDGEVHGDLHTV